MKLHVEMQEWSAAEAVAADADGVLEAVTDDGTEQTVTTGLGALPCPRSLSVTFGGTAADIKAIGVVVTGKRQRQTVTETFTATENTANTVQGSKIFSEVTSVVIPAHDGNGATTAVGWGDKLGLSYAPVLDTVLAATKNGATDGSAAITKGADLANSYVTMGEALDGEACQVVYFR